MEELCIKLDIPEQFKEKFELALDKSIKHLERRLKFAVASEILSKSKLTDKQADSLADELKKRVAKRHGV